MIQTSTMIDMIQRFFFSLCGLLLTGLLTGQERLGPLSSNLNYIYPSLRPAGTKDLLPAGHQKTTSNTPISLPFVEDFYYATTNQYPDQNKWEDSTVYVNTGMGIAPPSIGVATFDGLNKHGYPYNPTLANLTLSYPADVLTSKPINLKTVGQHTLDPQSDHVALSFYYQARGNGDSPEPADSLLVDFYRPNAHPDTAWKQVWFSRGNANSNINDTVFKRAFIRIKDTAYFHEGFRFRFRNWASVTGNFDHWHVDYIFLDRNRGDSLADTVRKDISIAYVPTSFLKNYSEMPFQQYQSHEMAQNISVKIRNNDALRVNMGYQYKVYDDQQNEVFNYNGQFQNLNPFLKNSYSPPGYGYSSAGPPAPPPVADAFVLPNPPLTINYRIKHFIFLNDNSSDILSENDTIIQHHNFRDFYAFDDGSAEAGYYVNTPLAKIAVKVTTNTPDTLQALRIYFDPAGNVSSISNTATSVHNFTLNVWSLGPNGGPGTLLMQDSVRQIPQYLQTGFKQIPEYRLRRPFPMAPGTYFFGIQQASNPLVIGFDKNYVRNTSLYYDAGSGWTQSSEKGSIMIHPLFRNVIPEIVGLNEHTLSQQHRFRVYPNPASEQLTITALDPPAAGETGYRIFNTTGQLVLEGLLEGSEQSISTGQLSQGLYVLVLTGQGNVIHRQKLIIQH
jgi:hypothetical protein